MFDENGAAPPPVAEALRSLLLAVEYERAENETLARLRAAGWRVYSGTGYRLAVHSVSLRTIRRPTLAEVAEAGLEATFERGPPDA